MGSEKLSELERLLKKRKGERWASIISVDPDSIGALLAMQFLCQRYDIQLDGFHEGTIEWPQNQHIITATKLRLKSSEDFRQSKYQGIVLLDSQGGDIPTVNFGELADNPYFAVNIDHHEDLDLKPQFKDVRPTYGSTSTILIEYLTSKKRLINRGEHSALATALALGLDTDTKNRNNASNRDSELYYKILSYTDSKMLRRLSKDEIDPQVLKCMTAIYGNYRIIQNIWSVGFGGYVPVEHREAIPRAADTLVRLKNMEVGIAYGIVGNQVRGSVRTSKGRFNCDTIIHKAFAEYTHSHPVGGGRPHMGAFKIPLKHYDEQDKDRLLIAVRNDIENKIEALASYFAIENHF